MNHDQLRLLQKVLRHSVYGYARSEYDDAVGIVQAELIRTLPRVTPTKDNMLIGGHYNWQGQPERLVYLGRNFSGRGYWHQFALVEQPHLVWSEVLDSELHMLEVSAQPEVSK